MRKIILFVLAYFLVASSAIAQNSKKTVYKPVISVADSLFGLSQWQNAIPVYEAVLKAAPVNSLAWNRLGFCYHNTGQLDNALLHYGKALEQNPPAGLLPTVHSRMARVLSMKKEHDNAFSSLEKALDAGYGSVGELENNNDFTNLRSDARFGKALMRAKINVMPCLAHEQARQFDFWIGEWDVYPNGANVLIGNNKIEMASGGCMILENWTAIGNVPNVGKSMNYVNPATGKWEQFWIGSGGITRNNPQKFVNGEYRDGAMRFEFTQTNAQGQTQIGRFIFFNEGPDQVRQFNEVSADQGKTWTTVYDFVYKRRKS
jgi:hypothetical protein